MTKAYFITAVGTPLTPDDQLHVEGLEAHLNDQWKAGIDGVLVAGTMGVMQLQSDETYENIIRESAGLCKGKGELMVGVGDASFVRTKKRLEFANQFDVDATVVLDPYMWGYSQQEYIDYFKALADISRAPMYMYHLPVLSGVSYDIETIQEIARHPNIKGIKCSCDLSFTRRIMDKTPDDFHVIVAQPYLVEILLQGGIMNHLDGIFAISPPWTVAIGKSFAAGDIEKATEYRRIITDLREYMIGVGIWGSFTVLLNERGIPGKFAPRPYRMFDDEAKEKFLSDPRIVRLLKETKQDLS